MADHVDLVRLQTQRLGAAQRHETRGLVGTMTGQPVFDQVPLAYAAESLHGVGAHTVPAELAAELVIGRSEHPVDVAPGEHASLDQVAAVLLVEQRALRVQRRVGSDVGASSSYSTSISSQASSAM